MNVAQYFERQLGRAPASPQVAKLALDSATGHEARRAIDAGRDLISATRRAVLGGDAAVETEIVAIVEACVSLFAD